MGVEHGVGRLRLDELLDVAACALERSPRHEDEQHVDQSGAFAVPAGVEPGLGGDGLREPSDGGDGVLDELGRHEAQQLVATPIERLLRAPAAPERAGRVDARARGPLVESGEPGGHVDGEVPAAGGLEPLDEPQVVTHHGRETVAVGGHVEQRRGEQRLHGDRSLGGEVGGEQVTRHGRPRFGAATPGGRHRRGR